MIDKLTYDVMNEIGLEIDSFNRVMDQDFRTLVTFKNKILKQTLREDEELIINHYNEVAMDLLHNKEQMRYIFGYFLNKKNNLDGQYFPLFYTVDNRANGKSRAEVKDQDGNIYSSKEYYSENLRYMDLILRIGEIPQDLTAYDIRY